MRTIGKTIITTAIVIALLALVDLTFGAVMSNMQAASRGGDTRNLHHINTSLTDSVIILGSSRANHHYDPSILAEKFGTSAYNCGFDGNGIILAYSFVNNMLQRGHRPRMIIYDFFPAFDLNDNNDRGKALSRIRPYYRIDGMQEIIDDIDPNEYVKLHLASYRYNTTFLQVISDYFKPQQHAEAGFKPMDGSMSTQFTDRPEPARPVDSIKAKYLRRLVETCRREGIRLVMVVSPYYFKPSQAERQRYDSLYSLYVGMDVPLLYFKNLEGISGNDSLFVDPSHMNREGARRFSTMLADTLASLFRH